jgi:conjugative transposon TraN protein
MRFKTHKKLTNMKKILCGLMMMLSAALYAQEKLPVVYLPENLTIHFISPEPIQYVDISTRQLAGDIPLKNVLRIKLKDSLQTFAGAVVTVAGEKFIAQYHLLPGYPGVPTEVIITPSAMQPLDIAGIGLSQNQLKSLALGLVAKSPDKRMEKVKAFGIRGRLNHVYTVGDYLFLDISYRNRTNLKYDISEFRFKVEDKKVTKAANNQSVEIRPEFVLFEPPAFTKYYRNIFVFKKMSFPGNKVLRAELSEKQLSGRVITLTISYQDILDADTLPN